jgi:hypothetical protein
MSSGLQETAQCELSSFLQRSQQAIPTGIRNAAAFCLHAKDSKQRLLNFHTLRDPTQEAEVFQPRGMT